MRLTRPLTRRPLDVALVAFLAVNLCAITVLFVRVSVPWMHRRMAARHPGWSERIGRGLALLPWPGRGP